MVSVLHPASFRDPSGFLFFHEGVLCRQVNSAYREHYECLMDTGLFKTLTGEGLLISHGEAPLDWALTRDAWKVIRPETVPFISYPYEWCFSQLKAAARATLEIQRRALEKGMSLKDCSAYNIQFKGARPTLIDTLSFEIYREGKPWGVYRQFCQHFLAPLALMSFTDIRLAHLLRTNIDGIPLDLAARLLPRRTLLNPHLLIHLHFHAGSQRRFAGRAVPERARLSRRGLMGFMESLQSIVEGLAWSPGHTIWAGYYVETNYSKEAFDHKKELAARFLSKAGGRIVWDLGANTGTFSRVASGLGMNVISLDADPGAVEKNSLESRRLDERNLLPLVIDLFNPSPALGWACSERLSLMERGPADTVMALALLHHLAIGNNLPFTRIADLLSDLCSHLIIELVPREDSQVQRLLAAREDIFSGYTKEDFEEAFDNQFSIMESAAVTDSKRVMYLMKRRV